MRKHGGKRGSNSVSATTPISAIPGMPRPAGPPLRVMRKTTTTKATMMTQQYSPTSTRATNWHSPAGEGEGEGRKVRQTRVVVDDYNCHDNIDPWR